VPNQEVAQVGQVHRIVGSQRRRARQACERQRDIRRSALAAFHHQQSEQVQLNLLLGKALAKSGKPEDALGIFRAAAKLPNVEQREAYCETSLVLYELGTRSGSAAGVREGPCRAKHGALCRCSR
jgi:hypothetical protein